MKKTEPSEEKKEKKNQWRPNPVKKKGKKKNQWRPNPVKKKKKKKKNLVKKTELVRKKKKKKKSVGQKLRLSGFLMCLITKMPLSYELWKLGLSNRLDDPTKLIEPARLEA